LKKDSADLIYRANAAAVAQAAVDEKLNSVLITLGEVKQAVAGLEQTPARRLEVIARAVITALASGIIGFFLAKF
jgi:hypothetical protein